MRDLRVTRESRQSHARVTVKGAGCKSCPLALYKESRWSHARVTPHLQHRNHPISDQIWRFRSQDFTNCHKQGFTSSHYACTRRSSEAAAKQNCSTSFELTLPASSLPATMHSPLQYAGHRNTTISVTHGTCELEAGYSQQEGWGKVPSSLFMLQEVTDFLELSMLPLEWAHHLQASRLLAELNCEIVILALLRDKISRPC